MKVIKDSGVGGDTAVSPFRAVRSSLLVGRVWNGLMQSEAICLGSSVWRLREGLKVGMRRGLASMAGEEGPEVASLGMERRKEHLLP